MKRTRIAALATVTVLPASLLLAPSIAQADPAPEWVLSGRYANGGAEVSAVFGDHLYVIGADATLDIVGISDPSAPELLATADLSAYGPSISSVAATAGRVAVAVPAADKTDPGTVLLLNPAGMVLRSATVGANPDMVAFDESGKRIVVANEGEPNSYVPKDDPEGTISIVDVTRLMGKKSDAVTTVGFADFNVGGPRHTELPADVRIFGPGATVAEDLEPEYVAISGGTAWVTLQENNAIAVVDLDDASVLAIRGLGTVDHSVAGSGIDASDRDGGINIATWPVLGMPMPDAIDAFTVGGATYLVTANEGDSRADWPGLDEEIRVKDDEYVLDPTVFPNAADLKEDEAVGRLTVTTQTGDTDGDGDYDEIRAFGSRSITIWSADVTSVWNSGDDIEQAVAAAIPANFNADNDENDVDGRSDNKGPEPEAVVTGVVGDRTYAFAGLERVGGFVVYDVTDPAAPVFVQYATSRDFTADPESSDTDSGPEVLRFVAAGDSPTGVPLLIMSNEVSHTVTIWTLG